MLSAEMMGHLLGRSPSIVYGPAARDFIAGRRVLVTGAGGSIGSELARQLETLNPSELHLLDHDESVLHALQLEIYGSGQLDHQRTILADIRDTRRIDMVFEEVQPEIVFHAAAHKHVTMLERVPSEAVKTNVLGTRNLLAASAATGVDSFILISTDKAAAPSNALGASKLAAELLVGEFCDPDGMRVSSVRFGNVLGSRGSFLPTLIKQIEQGRPVTVTHRDVERFFMSIPEAASLVIEAAEHGGDGEVFVLDMGDPVLIIDLVRRYAEWTNRPMPEIDFIGLSPGEKMSEVLHSQTEQLLPTSHPRVSQIPPEAKPAIDDVELKRLFEYARECDERRVAKMLKRITLDQTGALQNS